LKPGQAQLAGRPSAEAEEEGFVVTRWLEGPVAGMKRYGLLFFTISLIQVRNHIHFSIFPLLLSAWYGSWELERAHHGESGDVNPDNGLAFSFHLTKLYQVICVWLAYVNLYVEYGED